MTTSYTFLSTVLVKKLEGRIAYLKRSLERISLCAQKMRKCSRAFTYKLRRDTERDGAYINSFIFPLRSL